MNMGLHPVLALFRKLLDVCRRLGGRMLQRILRLFSFLTRRTGGREIAPKAKLTEEHPELRGILKVGTSGASSSVNASQSSQLPPIGRSVVLACASAPTTPPRVRMRDRPISPESYSSIGSILPRSPTLYDSPLPGAGNENGGLCSSPTSMSIPNRLSSIDESEERRESILLGDMRLSAEPAGFVASPKILRMSPTLPSNRPRYDRNIKIASKSSPWTFEPLDSYEVFRSPARPGYQFAGTWKFYVHPEGVPYYRFDHIASYCSFLTEADLRKDDVFEEIETFMCDLLDRLDNFPWKKRGRPGNLEAVLEIQNGWEYYLVDMDNQVVFWIDPFDMAITLTNTYGIESIDNFRGQLEFEYWMHVEHFPHRLLREAKFNEAIGALNYWRVDVITSADSTTPYEPSDIDSLVKSIDMLRATTIHGNCTPFAVATVARIMSIIGNERALNFYGSPGARLQVWQSVRGQQKKERRWLVKYLSPLLFYAPDTHLSGLEKQWVDGVIQERRWKKYQLKLERDWESFVLTSTVLLNANVALLTTPIVLAFDDGLLFASPAAAASQVSIVASIASIIIGLLLIRQIRISSKDIDINAGDAINYLSSRKHGQLGLETMAIQYSLPYALLMWGMVTFLTSIAIASFYKSATWPTTPVQLLYVVSWLFVIPLILWTVITGWETNSHTHWSDLLSADRWKRIILLHWEKEDRKKIWTWRIRKRPIRTTDPEERRDSDENTVGNGPEATLPTNDSATATHSGEGKQQGNWRVRVRNFGPVRRLTLALTR